jgi:Zn-dependent peptidase ImmA (M78 family)
MVAGKRSLIQDAAQAASDCREKADLDLVEPIDVYGLAEQLKVSVRFTDINMEGFYQKGARPQILLSALRPLARRAFTCAHELGHHWYGHGTTMDDLATDDRSDNESPNEVLANAFGSFLLMPPIGIRAAFNVRGWDIANPTPVQVLTVASEFGVGYKTLLTHLAHMTRDLPLDKKEALAKVDPKRIRKDLLGANDLNGLTILDAQQEARSMELEVGRGLIVPKGTLLDGHLLGQAKAYPDFDLYRASKRGQMTIKHASWTVQLRVSPYQFVGRAKFRFLEDPDE